MKENLDVNAYYLRQVFACKDASVVDLKNADANRSLLIFYNNRDKSVYENIIYMIASDTDFYF